MNKKSKRTVMSCAFVMFAFTANIHAQSAANPSAKEQYQQAKTLFDKGFHGNALSLLKISANRGYGPAMNAIGYCYQYGKGVSRNYTDALQWYKKAAVQGDATGAYNYGWMHLKGVGVRKDNEVAKKWLTSAANAGNADAKTVLKGLLNAEARQTEKPKQPKIETSKNSDKPKEHSSLRTRRTVQDSSKSEARPERRPQSGRNWRTGFWDSTINNLSDHPKTVVLRIDVIDKQTRLPIPNVQVAFAGTYWIGPRTSRHREGERQAQEIEYKISCQTGSKGIVVGAFSWHKEFPWSLGTDEVEKVQRIEIRHPQYKYANHRTPFRQFLEVGQKKTKPYPTNEDTFQRLEIPKRFETAWNTACSQPYVKLVVLDLGTGYKYFDEKKSSGSELFEKVYAKDWGEVFEKPKNMMKWGHGKGRSWCGPYLVYSIEIRLERVNRR